MLDLLQVLLLYMWSNLQRGEVAAFILAFTVSSLRMYQVKAYNVAESVLCGVLAGIAVTSLTFLSTAMGMSLPIEAHNFIAGAIGWYGTARTVRFVEQRIGGGKNDSDKDGI